jgi:hypothetical protein
MHLQVCGEEEKGGNTRARAQFTSPGWTGRGVARRGEVRRGEAIGAGARHARE